MRRSLISQQQDPVWEFMNEVQRAMDDIWQGSPTKTPATAQFVPAVDLHESPDFYLVSVDVPGVKQKDIRIDVQQGRLAISGERVRETASQDNLFKRFERAYGRFERTFQLPKNVDEGKIQARFENGVLEVMIPKAEVSKPKTIEIQSEKGGLFSNLLGRKTEGDGH